MGKVIVLDENTSNKIAAGEVIEKPASVVKELVENSIDAGAGSITVEVKNGGVSYIKVTDNGSGIEEDDVELAFERHATSKIKKAEDLEFISTMGFRGEALASIASVSTVELTTRIQKNQYGTYIMVQGGVTKEVRQTGCPVGTTFVIRDLFYNTPARFKFLKKDSTEAGYISDIMGRIALSNPQISFKLISNNAAVLHTPGNNDLLSTIFSIYGKDTSNELAKIDYKDDIAKISGYAGKPEIARATRNHQSIFINGRYVKSKVITSAIDEAYKTFLLKNKFAFIVMKIELNPMLVDVNVHPTKMEVRFSNEQDMFRSVYHAVSNALLNKPLVRTVMLENKEKNAFALRETQVPKQNFTQQKLNIERPFINEKPVENNFNENIYKSKNNLYEKENNIKEIDKDVSIDIRPSYSKAVENVEPQVKNEYQKKDVCIDDDCIEDVCKKDVIKDEDSAKPKNLLSSARVIGQAFSTYIVLQLDEELILIDQHAAHERIMYEQIKKKYLNNESMAQLLIAPVVIELIHQELTFLDSEKDLFNKLGFTYECFGANSIILRSVPYWGDNVPVKEAFMEVVDYVLNAEKTDYNRFADNTLYTIACKAAIKANKRLDDLEIQSMLKGMADVENPYTCPHGRPTIVKLTKHELEKMFKRIV